MWRDFVDGISEASENTLQQPKVFVYPNYRYSIRLAPALISVCPTQDTFRAQSTFASPKAGGSLSGSGFANDVVLVNSFFQDPSTRLSPRDL